MVHLHKKEQDKFILHRLLFCAEIFGFVVRECKKNFMRIHVATGKLVFLKLDCIPISVVSTPESVDEKGRVKNSAETGVLF